MTYIHIDGSQGEGGGQVLRSSLALSLVTGKPFTIDHIRAKRAKPGLMRQHLTAARAAAEVGGCNLENVKIGSVRLDFRPGKVRGGEYSFNIGTAGSATLVLQTILPALMLAEEPSILTLRGGTHNPMAPPFDFLQRVYLSLVAQLGPKFNATLVRHGFYPAGGGEFRLEITSVEKLSNLELTQRGQILERKAKILLARLPNHIADREKSRILDKTGWPEESVQIETIKNSLGPGNIVMLETISENLTELFTGFGEINVGAEVVAQKAVDQYREYLAAEVPVGKYLADQLMLPLGIAAWQGSGSSTFRTLPLSQHSRTHIDVLKRFLEIDIKTENVNNRLVDVSLR
jgi:RNA 3'-terminal phosphate cyclase (ATP)